MTSASQLFQTRSAQASPPPPNLTSAALRSDRLKLCSGLCWLLSDRKCIYQTGRSNKRKTFSHVIEMSTCRAQAQLDPGVIITLFALSSGGRLLVLIPSGLGILTQRPESTLKVPGWQPILLAISVEEWLLFPELTSRGFSPTVLDRESQNWINYNSSCSMPSCCRFKNCSPFFCLFI